MSRARVDSWDDHASLTGGIATEADLHSRFAQSPGFSAHQPSVGEAFKQDVAVVKQWVSNKIHQYRKQASHVNSVGQVAEIVTRPLPIVKTLQNYKLSYIHSDIAAGLVEGILKIPSGLAYALLCNMPPQYGLYTSLLPPFMYMCLGTCAQVSFGVTAIEALFLGESVRKVLGEDIVTGEDDASIDITVKYTLFISFMVGIWQLIFRLFRLGFISTLLADPVMSGFSTGGAFIIATSQLASWVGIKLPQTDNLFKTWVKAFQQFNDWNWVAFGMATCGITVLYALQYVNKRVAPKYPVPWQIFIVIFGIIVTDQLNLKEDHNLSIIGDIPEGFPSSGFPHPPSIPGKSTSTLFVDSIAPSFLIALFVYVMTLSLGSFFAQKNGYKVNAQQELLAVGCTTTISSLCGAFICSASFSRTAVVNTLGGKTVLHGVPALILMVLALTTITQQLYYLPKAILAAVVVNALGPMIEFRKGAFYYKTAKLDFAIWLLTFVVCIIGGAMYGIYAGVGAALLLVLIRAATAKTVVLGRLPGTSVYRNLERFPSAKETSGVKIVRFDGSLNFANWAKFVAKLQALATKDIHTIVLDASSILTVDSSSLRGLVQLVEDFDAKGVKLVLANWRAPQRDLLEKTCFYDAVPADTIFLTLHDAVIYARGRTFSPRKDDSTTASTAITETGGHKWSVGFHHKKDKRSDTTAAPADGGNVSDHA